MPEPRGSQETAVDSRDQWTVNHFSQSNPRGPGEGDVAKLLRSVANSLDELGEIVVQDIVFHSEPTADEDELTMTVYYYRRGRDE